MSEEKYIEIEAKEWDLWKVFPGSVTTVCETEETEKDRTTPLI